MAGSGMQRSPSRWTGQARLLAERLTQHSHHPSYDQMRGALRDLWQLRGAHHAHASSTEMERGGCNPGRPLVHQPMRGVWATVRRAAAV